MMGGPKKRNPAGGTAGLANIDLAISDNTTEPGGAEQRVSEAAGWLAENWHVCPQPVTRALRDMFGLGFNDAVKAIAEARRIGGQK